MQRFPTRQCSFNVPAMLDSRSITDPSTIPLAGEGWEKVSECRDGPRQGRKHGGRAVNFMNFRGEGPMGTANIGTIRGVSA